MSSLSCSVAQSCRKKGTPRFTCLLADQSQSRRDSSGSPPEAAEPEPSFLPRASRTTRRWSLPFDALGGPWIFYPPNMGKRANPPLDKCRLPKVRASNVCHGFVAKGVASARDGLSAIRPNTARKKQPQAIPNISPISPRLAPGLAVLFPNETG